MIAKVQEYELETLTKDIEDLIKSFDTQDNMKIVNKMKQIIPEYKSQHSIYEKLDI